MRRMVRAEKILIGIALFLAARCRVLVQRIMASNCTSFVTIHVIAFVSRFFVYATENELFLHKSSKIHFGIFTTSTQ